VLPCGAACRCASPCCGTGTWRRARACGVAGGGRGWDRVRCTAAGGAAATRRRRRAMAAAAAAAAARRGRRRRRPARAGGGSARSGAAQRAAAPTAGAHRFGRGASKSCSAASPASSSASAGDMPSQPATCAGKRQGEASCTRRAGRKRFVTLPHCPSHHPQRRVRRHDLGRFLPGRLRHRRGRSWGAVRVGQRVQRPMRCGGPDARSEGVRRARRPCPGLRAATAPPSPAAGAAAAAARGTARGSAMR
jgi:hypothetical protein